MTNDRFDELRTYIIDELVSEDTPVNDTTSLFSTRIVNSRNLMQLVRFIEDGSNIRVDTMDLTLENFDTVERIIDYINRKMG